MSTQPRWTITVNGKKYENVLGLRFIPKITHKKGGEMPINLTVLAYANGVQIGSSTGTITSSGETAVMTPIEWYPSTEGTYTVEFSAQAVDSEGRTGTSQTGLTAIVEKYVAPPEIEIVVEVS